MLWLPLANSLASVLFVAFLIVQLIFGFISKMSILLEHDSKGYQRDDARYDSCFQSSTAYYLPYELRALIN